MSRKVEVTVDYYKQSGKWYTEETYQIDAPTILNPSTIYEIRKELRNYQVVGGECGMKNTAKAITDIGQLIRGCGSSIDHRTYRDICDELARLVGSADGDITDEQYTDWWNGNISHHEDDW